MHVHTNHTTFESESPFGKWIPKIKYCKLSMIVRLWLHIIIILLASPN